MNAAQLRIVAAITSLAAFVSAVSAQDAPAATQVINLYGNTLTFPLPNWVPADAGAGGVALSEISRKQEGPSFIFEMVPKQEGFDNWTQLYAVLAIQDDRVAPERMVNDLKRVFGQGCNKVILQPIKGPDDGVTLAFYCESFVADPARGEIAVHRILKTGDVTARIYHEWRGKAFSFDDAGSWPASRDDVQAMADRLNEQVRMTPPQ